VTENFRARGVGEERVVAGLRLFGVLVDPTREAVRAPAATVLNDSFRSREVLNDSFKTSPRPAVAEAGEGLL
jgi:hypothetical protein